MSDADDQAKTMGEEPIAPDEKDAGTGRNGDGAKTTADKSGTPEPISPWFLAEFFAWTVVALVPFLTWVNGRLRLHRSICRPYQHLHAGPGQRRRFENRQDRPETAQHESRDVQVSQTADSDLIERLPSLGAC